MSDSPQREITPTDTAPIIPPLLGGASSRSAAPSLLPVAPVEAALDQNALYRLLIDTVRDHAIFALDANGYVLTWNPGAQRFTGYAAEEIIGQHFSMFYPAARVAEGFPQFELREAARTGRFEDEGWRVRKGGALFWASVVITALRNDAGELVGFAKVTRDLTERRLAQERAIEDARRVAAEEASREAAEDARERTQRLQALTAALSAARTIPEIARVIIDRGLADAGADAGALALESAGEVRIVGDAGYAGIPDRLRRVSPRGTTPLVEAMRTKRPLIFWNAAERDARFPKLATLLAPFEASVMIPLVGRDRAIGGIAMHRAVGNPLTDDALGFMLDFAVQCGQAIERAQLYEAEQQARARADEANRAKSEFLAAMSHELRTPLNAIGGYAELMQLGLRGPVSEDQRADLDRIKRSQQHLLGIINDILNFSRIEAGQIAYDLADVPVHAVLESVGQMIAPQAAQKQVAFDVAPPAADLRVVADRAKLEQVMLNLLSNAVKFTPADGVVHVCVQDGADAQVRLVVHDTGRGIPPDQLETIFEPFVQVGRSLTTASEGTGLGLAISRDLARGMGGDISVESTVDVGSTFTVALPRA